MPPDAGTVPWFWISVAGAGVAAACWMRWLMAPALGEAGADARRDWPWGLRLAWPWIAAAASVCGPWLTWQARRRLAIRLRRAGCRSGIGPEHVAGAQAWLAGMGAGGAAAMALAGGQPPAWACAAALPAAVCAAGVPRLWLARRIAGRARLMQRQLPFLLDLTTLCVEAGLTLQGALQQAVERGPEGPLRDAVQDALSDMRAGMARQQALRALAERSGLPALGMLVAALVQAETLGMSLGPLLRAQSDRHRNERFLRAERLAMEAPVKMLLPLVACIFPCTFLVIGFPIAVRLMAFGS